jgi:DNA-binding protein HU-beta
MRKSEFVAAVAKEAGMSQRDTEKVIDALNPVIVKSVVEGGEEISLPFGKFKQKVNAAKTGTNPLTKKPMNVPESHTLAFKASKTVKKVMEPKPARKSKK